MSFDRCNDLIAAYCGSGGSVAAHKTMGIVLGLKVHQITSMLHRVIEFGSSALLLVGGRIFCSLLGLLCLLGQLSLLGLFCLQDFLASSLDGAIFGRSNAMGAVLEIVLGTSRGEICPVFSGEISNLRNRFVGRRRIPLIYRG